mmetsp:Transcript_2858/g.6792  ORF Transcript_2858/g.6792 Transcript_2858/m.6792 type:complete len:163 (-) Transcript_2858:50-538(-)
MSMSGISVSDSAVDAYNGIKTHKYEFAVFKIGESKEVVEDEKLRFPSSEEDVAAFKQAVSDKSRESSFRERVWPKLLDAVESFEKEPRYIVVDFGFRTKDNRDQAVLSLIRWSPDNSGVRARMLYASTANGLSESFEGLAKNIQANDFSDLDYDTFFEKVTN